ncbi:hypothetical protein TEA_021837 [Camellia sinensis var. sinensis]|uniref:CRM domain-containing protein n=1 Tax=Camellia sinensis var. sinensis TaxID=542762 RepID=A0A4S4DR88_CAMSN|nr:hypothetical protein TEA_021837 [Camellia sinensis var. sinensis]
MVSNTSVSNAAKNGYYGSLVPMVRDAFLAGELVRIDCQGLEKSDDKKLGCKLRDLVPCVLVTCDKEQVVVWRERIISRQRTTITSLLFVIHLTMHVMIWLAVQNTKPLMMTSAVGIPEEHKT